MTPINQSSSFQLQTPSLDTGPICCWNFCATVGPGVAPTVIVPTAEDETRSSGIVVQAASLSSRASSGEAIAQVQ